MSFRFRASPWCWAWVAIFALIPTCNWVRADDDMTDTVQSAADPRRSIQDRNDALANSPLPSDLPSVPRIKCPVYVQEFHIWYHSAFGQGARPGFVHWFDDSGHGGGASGPEDPIPRQFEWRRNNDAVGYPLLGFYNPEDENIIRWQLQCAKNAGIDGLFVQRFADPNRKIWDEFKEDYIFQRIIKIAGEVGIGVGVHDEVYYYKNTPAQSLDVMTKRAGEFLKNYGNRKGYLHINGKPAYAFQFWSEFNRTWKPDDLRTFVQNVAAISGTEPYIIPFDSPGKIYGVEEAHFIAATNFAQKLSYDDPRFSLTNLPPFLLKNDVSRFLKAKSEYPGLDIGLHGDPAYHDIFRGDKWKFLPRRNGKTMVEMLEAYNKLKPSFIILTSWNDWLEDSAIEPGLIYEGTSSDPYLYVKILAAAKGKQFIAPALPPRESVDPLLWQTLYGIDRTPPRVSATYAPNDQTIKVTAADSGHPVTSCALFERADASWSIDSSGRSVTDNLSFAGFTGPQPAPVMRNTGVSLAPRQGIQLEIAGDVFPAGQPDSNDPYAYVAIEYIDHGKGVLEFTYPSTQKLIDDKQGDDNLHAVMARIVLNGDGAHHAAVRQLRGIKAPKEGVGKLLLAFRASESDRPEAVIIGIKLFVHLLHPHAGAAVSESDAERTKTYSFQVTGSAPGDHSFVYIVAEDSEHNQSVPNPAAISK